MAQFIPERSTCLTRMTAGERRLSERLTQKLDDHHLIWYDVPVGPRQRRPDFIVLHPHRGLLVLEVKDIKAENLRSVDARTWHFFVSDTSQIKGIQSPLEQARECAIEAVKLLQKDAQLVQADGPHQGKLSFPWGHGVVLSNITRKQFNDMQLGEALPEHRVICRDEMVSSVDAESFKGRLWDMFPYGMPRAALTPEQIDRVRAILFPQLRIGAQMSLLAPESDEPLADEDVPEVPDFLQVMDLQQEQLARSLGEGHRIIHGVAGSGKTMILTFRAEHLARSFPAGKPILVLCFNRALSQKLAETMRTKGLQDRVLCRTFHQWCGELLRPHTRALPPTDKARQDMFADQIERVLRGVAEDIIPSGQYMSVLIDEAHDFEPDWLRLIVSQVSPATKSLLVLYDDAQSIYQKRRRGFSLKSVGIEAQGRTNVLRINYRNTQPILQCASRMAQDLLKPHGSDDDGIPTLAPVSCGRQGPAPLFIHKLTVREQARAITQALLACRDAGHDWHDMAVLAHQPTDLFAVEAACKAANIPSNPRGELFLGKPRVNLLGMKVSKGLEFPVIALLGGVATQTESESEAAETRRLHYVAATRATHRLIVATRQGLEKPDTSSADLRQGNHTPV